MLAQSDLLEGDKERGEEIPKDPATQRPKEARRVGSWSSWQEGPTCVVGMHRRRRPTSDRLLGIYFPVSSIPVLFNLRGFWVTIGLLQEFNRTVGPFRAVVT